MSDKFRKIANSYLLKAIFTIIIISFFSWSLGDIIRNSGSNNIISINNKYHINKKEFQRNKINYIYNLENNFGYKLNNEQIKNPFIDKIVLDDMINFKLFELLTNRFKINISDKILIDQIKSNYNLDKEQKHFDKENLLKLLRNNLLSEKEFGKIIATEQVREFIQGALSDNELFPNKLTEILEVFANEKRNFSLAYIETDKISLPTPTKEQLNELYKTRQEDFLIPEFRKISYIELSPQNVKPNIKISEGQVKEEYKNYIAENYTLEKRDIYNLTITEKSKAEEALKLLKAGQDFLKLAEKYSSKSLDRLLMKSVSKSELQAELQEEVFNLEKDAISDLIATNQGFHIIKILAIQKVPYPRFETIKHELYTDLLKKKSEEIIYDYAKIIQEEINNDNISLEILAKKFNLPVISLDEFNSFGENISDSKVNLPELDNIKETLFNKKEGEFELIEDNSNLRYFLFYIDKIKPQKYEDLESSLHKLTEIWNQQQKEVYAKNLLAEFHQMTDKGIKNLEKFASEKNIRIEKNNFIYRRSELDDKLIKNLPQKLISDLMKLKNGEVSDVYLNNSGKEYLIAQLDNIDFSQRNIGVTSHVRYNQLYQQSIISDLINYLRLNSKIEFNKKNFQGQE